MASRPVNRRAHPGKQAPARTQRCPDPAQLRSLYQAGNALDRLAVFYGVTESIIRQWLAHGGVALRPPGPDAYLAHLATMPPSPGAQAPRGGTRADLGIYVRSAWEANYARYLTWLQAHGEIHGWAYEPRTFVFEGITRGTRDYTPDFQAFLTPEAYEWHEVKGWMDAKSRTRLTRMASYFPEERIVVIDQGWFRQAKQAGLDRLIPHWERRAPR